MPSMPAHSLSPSLSSLLPPSNLLSTPAASRAFTSPSPPHPVPPPPPQNGAPPHWEEQPGARGDDAMDTGEEGLEGAAGASSGWRYGPGEGFDVNEFSMPGQLGSVVVAAAAREAAVLDLTASDEETDKEEVRWAVWHEALTEVVGEETPASRAWREAHERFTIPYARERYAAAAAIVVSLKRSRRHARDWRDYPKLDAQEACGHAAFAIYDILADTLLRATARDKARYERISQHRCREQQRQHAPLPQ
ncbi:hypothetical protein JCM8097_008188, partial [Rhodosporidiobolus ruineniae]